MSERVTPPDDIDDTNWNNDGSTYPSTAPIDAKRLTGFKPKDVPPGSGDGETITANDQNWLHGLTMLVLTWFKKFVPREWGDMWEALSETDDTGDLFRVYPEDPIQPIGSSVFDVAGSASGGGIVRGLCADGAYLYYFSGSPVEYLVAAEPTNGDEAWQSQPLGANVISALCCDGAALYITSAVPGKAGLRVISRSDGSETANGGSSYGCVRMAVNGQYCVGVAPDGGVGKVVVWTTLGGTPTEPGEYDTEGDVKSVAIDRDQCYIGGTRFTYDVWSVTLATQALEWRITLPTTTAPTVHGISADGEVVYISTDRKTLSAGGSANLYCLDRSDGSLLWSMDVDSAASVDLVLSAVDDHYLYCAAASTLYVLCVNKPTPGVVAKITDLKNPVCDGVSVAGIGNPASTFKRNWVIGATKTFMRASGSDPGRRPFHTLAIPVD